MMAIKGIYAEYGVQRLNHGIGFDTAAIELLLPTYARVARPQGQDLPALGAQPASDADPGDRSRASSSRCIRFGSEAGHGRLHPRAARRVLHRPRRHRCAPTARSARPRATTPATCSSARRCRSTCRQQLDGHARAASPASAAHRTWAPTRAAAATPAPHGSRPGARRARAAALMPRGRKLVVQMVETFREHMQPAFVETARCLGAGGGRRAWQLPPVMIYGDDVTPHPDRGRHRQPAAVPQRRGARAGDPRRGRLHAGRARARQAHGGEPARPRRHPPRPRISASTSAHADARPAGGAIDQGSCALVRRPVRPAEALPQLVRDDHGNPAVRFESGTRGRGTPAAHALVGVVGSGNLEVLIEPAPLERRLPHRGHRPQRSASARSGRR